MKIRFATSPDADDLFMAWPLLTGKLDCAPYFFLHEALDTQSLNDRASGDDPPEICAVSIAKVPSLADRYWLMPAGASVGRGYGPVVVTRDGTIGTINDLAHKKVAIPGLSTTAFLVLQILCREHGVDSFVPVVVKIVPFERVFEALRAGEVDAALLIHEGRLTYTDDPALHLVCDIGIEWQKGTGLPLPLGGNVIAKSLGISRANELNSLLAQSIRFALDHQDQMINELVSKTSLTRDRLVKYLAMYANHDSIDLAGDAIAAITELSARGRAWGLADADVPLLPPADG
jgi:1,4-dihydroxy-6-naphthoate synthase